MTFNSIDFLIFLIVFILIYYSLPGVRSQNIFCLAASYFFYGYWDWRFLGLLVFSSGVDFIVGQSIHSASNERRRKRFLLISVVINLGVLGIFKYYDFFVENFSDLLISTGFQPNIRSLEIILPIGISFYTFQSMSYTLDIYRNRMKPERNVINFLAYVSFFPQLVAGPIERARHLLPQFNRERSLSAGNIEEAVWLLVYGFFLKVVVADGLAHYADWAFVEGQDQGWSTLLGTAAFTFQIYADFNGYSLIARGCALLLGFHILYNFNLPYFAKDLREFWQRWHISLSSWLRDYLYVSLGGNRQGTLRTFRNLMITMLLGGLWHGAAWHFVIWGGFHGLGLVMNRALVAVQVRVPIVSWALTFFFVMAGWFIFRVDSMAMASDMVLALDDLSWQVHHTNMALGILVLIAIPLFIELRQFARGGSSGDLGLPRSARVLTECVMVFLVVVMFGRTAKQFIYFQF